MRLDCRALNLIHEMNFQDSVSCHVQGINKNRNLIGLANVSAMKLCISIICDVKCSPGRLSMKIWILKCFMKQFLLHFKT